MPTNEHLVLCGGNYELRRVGSSTLHLSLHGTSKNVILEIADISKQLVANIPDALADLLEVASYVYAADSAISRGGDTVSQMGARWRRKFRFIIPVRLPGLWSSDQVLSALVETLGFLSEDEYHFEFRPLANPPAVTDYFAFPDSDAVRFTPNEVILFSGGLDSFSGALEELVAHRRKVALVSHRSSPKIFNAQKYLVEQLRRRFGANRILHVPIRATLKGRLGIEQTHRTRSFLFAALGTAVAGVFNRNRILFFENGVMSLNLPPVAQVVGARATRSTHPQVLAGFRRVLSAVLGRSFNVDNPFGWMTKTEVVERISANRCDELLRHTRSCTRVRDMTILHPHCGQCSQCIDRRFAVFAAGLDHQDPAEAYKVDLFTGSRQPGKDREMALAFVRSASYVNQMTDEAFIARYGETTRVVDFFPEPADTVAGRVFDLYRRHAATICGVFDRALKLHAPDLRQGKFEADCLLLLVVSQSEGGRAAYPELSGALDRIVADEPEIRIAIDEKPRRVVFNRWGVISGKSAALIIALSNSFREATRAERAPENYPFIKGVDLARLTDCDSTETLRRRIHLCRKRIMKLAMDAGDALPSLEVVIENIQWHGYRLNPDRIRIVAVSELAGSR